VATAPGDDARWSAGASFAASEFAAAGAAVPVHLDVVNASARSMSELRIATNQLFTYRLDVALPPGRVGTVAFAPWYFDGPLSFGGAADTLSPRLLPEGTALLLFDPDDVRPERLTDHLMQWTLHYFPPVPGRQAQGLPRPEPVALESLTAPLVKGSVALGLAVSAERADLAALRRLAADAGKDLWTIDTAGTLALLEAVPAPLRRLAARNHVRADLFDLSAAGGESHVADKLFSIRSADWSADRRLTYVVPVVVVTALLVCLAMLGWRLRRAVKLIAALAVLVAGAAWIVLAVRASEFTFADAVTITTCDSPSGRAMSEHLVSVSGLRREPVALRFQTARLGPPRPLMAADVDRTVYDGIVLHRDFEGRWAVEGLDVRPGLLLAFGVNQWELASFPAGDVTLGVQSGRREVRLTAWRSLEDAWLYDGNQAHPMGAAAEDGAYRASDVPVSIDGAAYSCAAPADAFRRRVMRWVGRNVARPGTPVFFGWEAAATPVAADGARMVDHGRLIIWLVQQPEAGAL